jgi:hypothetical protein
MAIGMHPQSCTSIDTQHRARKRDAYKAKTRWLAWTAQCAKAPHDALGGHHARGWEAKAVHRRMPNLRGARSPWLGDSA